MQWKDIPQYTREGHYCVDVPLDSVEAHIKRFADSCEKGLELEPDFQRAHVWSADQQEAFVAHILKGGAGSSEIRFNCPGWLGNFEGPIVLVDGLQRLTAVRRFMAGELRVFGHLVHEFEGRLPLRYGLKFRMNDLATRREVLEWYLQINTGGTPHTDDEIAKVYGLYAEEVAK